MIIFYKNYKRTDRTFISIQSVKHMFPDIDVRCLFLYDNDTSEYDLDIEKFKSIGVTCYLDKKTYNFKKLSAAGSSLNGYYFTEGINKIYNIVKNYDTKVLILDEDSYFTNGDTIKFLLSNQFDLGWAYWKCPPNPIRYPKRDIGINGSIVAINPKNLSKYFPIPEVQEYIEHLLGFELYDKCINDGLSVIKIPTRLYDDYCGDGTHTNDIEEMKLELVKNNINFKEL